MNHSNNNELSTDQYTAETEKADIATWILICIILGLINIIMVFF